MSRQIRLAMIGCGAVAEQAHLPAGRLLHNGCFTLLVDTNESRAAALARSFGIDRSVRDWRKAADCFDAALVALPHHLHEPVCCELLAAGKHVLVEKPLARSVREAEAMIAAANRSGTMLAVGLMRRFGWAPLVVRRLAVSGALGTIESFDFQEGGIYDWPVASDFFFRRETAGGGVLIDTGAHTLDLLLWWLGDYAEVEYADDSAGGVEADCCLNLSLQSGAQGVVELSRIRGMRNTAIIRGRCLTIEVHLHVNRLRVRATGTDIDLTGELVRETHSSPQYYPQLVAEQLQQWVDAIRAGCEPHVPAPAALPSIRLIEQCYARRQQLMHPWMAAPAITR